MIVQEMDFRGADYAKIVALKEELRLRGQSHKFFNYRVDSSSINPQTIHTSYPNVDAKSWDRTLATLYLWEREERGQIAFITPSPKSFQAALEAVRTLIKDPTKQTKSGLELVTLA